MYLEVAKFMAYEIPAETMTKIDDAHALSATVVRNTWQFGEGFVTGQGDTNAGLAGAVSSDLTVVGDVRDIAAEGTKMLAGEEYSELILGFPSSASASPRRRLRPAAAASSPRPASRSSKPPSAPTV